MTPDGVKRTEAVNDEFTHSGRKTDGVIVAGLVGVLVLGVWQQMTKVEVVYKDNTENVMEPQRVASK